MQHRGQYYGILSDRIGNRPLSSVFFAGDVRLFTIFLCALATWKTSKRCQSWGDSTNALYVVMATRPHFFHVSAVPFRKSCYKFASVGDEGANTLIFSPYKTPRQLHWPVSLPPQTNSAPVKNSTISRLFVSSCARVLLITVPLFLRGIVFQSSPLPVDGHLLHHLQSGHTAQYHCHSERQNSAQTSSSFSAVLFLFIYFFYSLTGLNYRNSAALVSIQCDTNADQQAPG